MFLGGSLGLSGCFRVSVWVCCVIAGVSLRPLGSPWALQRDYLVSPGRPSGCLWEAPGWLWEAPGWLRGALGVSWVSLGCFWEAPECLRGVLGASPWSWVFMVVVFSCSFGIHVIFFSITLTKDSQNVFLRRRCSASV